MLSQPFVLQHRNLEALALEPVDIGHQAAILVSPGVKVGVDSPAHPLQHQQVNPATGHLLRQSIVHPAIIQMEAPL